MSTNTPPSASDSSENVVLTPQVGSVEHADSSLDEVERMQTIIEVVKRIARPAFEATLRQQGGDQVVWESLDKSGYRSLEDLCRHMQNSVVTFFAKLTAKRHMDEGEISVRPAELQQAYREILEGAFANHGIRLREFLDELKMRKTS